MNAKSGSSARPLQLPVWNTKAKVAALFISVIDFNQAQSAQPAQPPQAAQVPLSYTVTDLGTLGGSTSTASTTSGQISFNQAGMFVGSSTTTDNSEHAFLYTGGQMYDLNLLCDLSTSNFKVLVAARTINDCFEIVGEGVTTNGDKHAFLLKPTAVDGGNWCYACCKWTWTQEGGGWTWDTGCHCYTWHGPPGNHPPCPPQPPHCFWWPLPCPPDCGCPPPPPPPDYCWCCINGVVYFLPLGECQLRGGQCYGSREEAFRNCKPCWCCIDGKVVQTTWADCEAKRGKCYNSPVEAKRNCVPCCCCIKGEVFQTTWVECQRGGGQCYNSAEEARAHCKPC